MNIFCMARRVLLLCVAIISPLIVSVTQDQGGISYVIIMVNTIFTIRLMHILLSFKTFAYFLTRIFKPIAKTGSTYLNNKKQEETSG